MNLSELSSVDSKSESRTSVASGVAIGTGRQYKTVSDPLTLEGQQLGALLQVMRVPDRIKKVRKGSEYNMIIEVGDICEVLDTQFTSFQGKDRVDYVVENLRTCARVMVPWNTFLKVDTREMCNCARKNCRCVYVDFDKSQEFLATL